MPLLEVRNLTVHYGRIGAVHDLDLTVNEGEIVSLIGANGAGKSTTMRAIAGLLSLTTGTIRLAGEEITKVPPHARVARGLSLAPEGRGIFPTGPKRRS